MKVVIAIVVVAIVLYLVFGGKSADKASPNKQVTSANKTLGMRDWAHQLAGVSCEQGTFRTALGASLSACMDMVNSKREACATKTFGDSSDNLKDHSKEELQATFTQYNYCIFNL